MAGSNTTTPTLMASDQQPIPSDDETPPADGNGNSSSTSLGALLLRAGGMFSLLAIAALDWHNPDWEPPQLIVVGFIAALLGITGREAVDLLKHKLGGK